MRAGQKKGRELFSPAFFYDGELLSVSVKQRMYQLFELGLIFYVAFFSIRI